MPPQPTAPTSAEHLATEIERDPHLRSIADKCSADLARDLQRERDFIDSINDPMHPSLWGLCRAEESMTVRGEPLTTEMGGVGRYAFADAEPRRSARDMMRPWALRQSSIDAYDRWGEMYGLPSYEDLMHFSKATLLLNGKPIGTVRNVTFTPTAEASPAPPPPPLGVYTASATLTFADGGRAFERFARAILPKRPRPTPKQYRLRRRAAWAKRRGRAR